ncbi:MAG: S1C family serine protease, partial [Actinomycetota bacterium]|nr:S1C family serine protease [Actinomycetota bacterium]
MDERTIFEIPESTMPRPPEPPPPPAPERPRRPWLVSALVGALVGAAVSGGIVAAVQDDGGASTSVAEAPSRPSNVLNEPGDIASILATVTPAVVSISTRGFTQDDFFSPIPSQGSGTGVILTPDGEVLTNAHVIADAASIKVKLSTDDRTYDATLLGSDPAADLALIRIQGVSNLPVATLGRSAELQVGDQV